MSWINFIVSITKDFWCSFGIASLFVVAILAILILEREKLKKYIFVWYPAIILVLIYNPLTTYASLKVLGDSDFEQYYLRLFALVPVAFIICFGLTLILSHFVGYKKFIGFLLGVVIIVILGQCLYTEDWFTKAYNRNKVPVDVVQLSDMFGDDVTGEIRIMCPQRVAVYIRQIDSRFSMWYGRYVDDEEAELTSSTPNVETVIDYCEENDLDYVVVSAIKDCLDTYVSYGFELVGYTENYAVLKVCEKADWLLTEYPDASGDQGLFYTMVNRDDGTLIVVDGGDAENEETVRDAIEENGGVVDAWIITHFHQDHVDAFNAIYKDPQGIEIKEIYTTPLDADVFYEVAQDWDDVDSFEAFMSETADATNLNYVSRNDTLSFGDLKITFFNAYDDVVLENGSDDIPNNDSLVFKMETEKKSILFCADCHSEGMAKYLVETYGDELKSDILQCGHHGNNSMPTETGFYETVSPTIAVFDAPDWVMQGDTYTAAELQEYLNCEGVFTESFVTAPHVFGF